ncbi:MAG: T9SS type A sorting domain-containing protein [Bacteroidetes bacterium]|nr:T9SS type A sorting domain-containing protein [Bacteroidota bacterium]
MKKLFLSLCLILTLFASESFSQFGNSRAIVENYSASTFIGRFATFPNGNCGSIDSGAYVGVIPCNLDGVANTPFYCLDLCTPISIGDTVKDSASTIPQAIYITDNYYPEKTSYPGKLANNNDEACAVQFAIWHFRNNLDPNSIITVDATTTATIIARANAIIADVNLNGGSSVHVSTIEIKPAVDPDKFYIETKDTANNPIAVSNITLTLSGSGSLSTYNVSTNGSGVSPDVTVTGASNGDVITASATVQIPGGVTYSGLSTVLQLLVLGKTTTGIRTAQTTWGALPVELSSFTASISGRDITLNWSTSKEINNSGFEIERYKNGIDVWERVGYVSGHGNTSSPQNYSFTNRNLTSGIYTYRLKQIDYNGNYEYHNLNGEVVVGVPNDFELSQNYPNPFNPETKISYQIPRDAYVSLKVYNNSGKEVATLVNNSVSAGYYTVNFNAANLSSGIYFYKLETEGFTKVMKMAVVK